MKNKLENLAKKISKENNFKIAKKIYQAYYYSKESLRNIIYSGIYKEKPAVLKIYSDHRNTYEPISLKNFNKINKSKILIAPKLYKHKIISPKSGWLIMEKLPKKVKLFKSPLNEKERKEFLELYLEYRRTFPKKPTRKLSLIENLQANEFHIFRINRWLRLANDKEVKIKNPALNPDQFIPRFKKAIKIINKEFSNRKMIWCHGHFKPKEIFKINDNLYYLTDFAHTAMYPEGYELAFIVWADYLMASDWKLNYNKWREGVFSWIDNIEKIAKELKIKKFIPLIKASLIERIIGTILADVCASDRPRQEKIKKISLLYDLFDDLIK